MKIISSSKEITTLEVGDKVVFGNLEYKVVMTYGYYLSLKNGNKSQVNDEIFKILNISKKDFVNNLGIDIMFDGRFPETKSLEALTAIVSALFKEYEKQNKLPKTWEEFCERNKMGDKRFCLYNGDIIGTGVSQSIFKDATLIESVEEARAFRALMQLRQLRKAYVKDWEPDWMDDKTKFALHRTCDKFYIYDTSCTSCALSFPTYELAKQFLTNFKDILEIAKPLLG